MARALLCSLFALTLTLCSCSESGAAPAEAKDAARAAFDSGDSNGALVVVNRALSQGADSAALRLVAGEACLQLERLGDALAHAEVGLGGDASGALAADLRWVEGAAAGRRFMQLGADDDWRRSNSALQVAADSGSHRGEAAYLLTWLHTRPGKEDDARALKYGRLCLSLNPGETVVGGVTKLLGERGLTP